MKLSVETKSVSAESEKTIEQQIDMFVHQIVAQVMRENSEMTADQAFQHVMSRFNRKVELSHFSPHYQVKKP